MVVRRGVQLKLYPTYQQRKTITEEARRTRYLWNMFIELNSYNMFHHGKRLSYLEMNRMLMDIKNDEYLGWYQPPSNAQSCQQTLRRLEETYSRWATKVAKEPRFKSRKRDNIAMTYPQHVKFNYNGTKILVPSLGEVNCKGYRQLDNMVIKQLVITVTPSGDITASIHVECENQAPTYTSFRPLVGIDVGTKKFLTDNSGQMIRPSEDITHTNRVTGKLHVVKKIHLKRELSKLNKLHSYASTRTTSNSKAKAYRRVNKQYKRINNIRMNWLHHIANMYRDYGVVYIEDLNITKMTINTVGTLDNPNKDSKRKTNLNRNILQMSWGTFFQLLEYKLQSTGGRLVRVDPMFTSQTCSCCGRVNKSNRVGEVYKCNYCSNVMDADHNASVNILKKGMVFDGVPEDIRELNNMYL